MPAKAEPCRTYNLPKLKSVNCDDDYITEEYALTPSRIVPLGGQHNRRQSLPPDYVLNIRRNIPIAVMEAKAAYKNAGDGLAQAI